MSTYTLGQNVTLLRDISELVLAGTRGVIVKINNDETLEIDVPGWAMSISVFPDEIQHTTGEALVQPRGSRVI